MQRKVRRVVVLLRFLVYMTERNQVIHERNEDERQQVLLIQSFEDSIISGAVFLGGAAFLGITLAVTGNDKIF